MRRLVPAAAALALLALTACSDDGEPTATGSPSAAVTTATTAPATSAPASATASGPSCPAAPEPPAGTTVITATVTKGKVTTEHEQWSVKTGTPVRIAVTADVADEVHVHSYDKKQDTTPGCPTALDLVANIPGSVEVELEDAGLELFTLKAS
ncbi:MAG TPA: hypothetical protein VFQ85_18745 [Mycobacteriales bacterium]|nr:hypothetical protein [Mycobacteriales bacterium]